MSERQRTILTRLASEIEGQAATCTRPGQMGDLNRIAMAVRDIVEELSDGVFLPQKQADALREFFEDTGEHHGREQREKAAETLGVDR